MFQNNYLSCQASSHENMVLYASYKLITLLDLQVRIKQSKPCSNPKCTQQDTNTCHKKTHRIYNEQTTIGFCHVHS